MPLSWVPESNGQVPAGAFPGGHESKGEITYIIRAREGGDLCPGKLPPTHKHGYIPYSGKECPKNNYEVLVGDKESLEWVSGSDGSVPHNAVPGGKTSKDETLYIGRVEREGALITGKIHPSLKALYYPYGGKELKTGTYDVLVEKVVPVPLPVVVPPPPPPPVPHQNVVILERHTTHFVYGA